MRKLHHRFVIHLAGQACLAGLLLFTACAPPPRPAGEVMGAKTPAPVTASSPTGMLPTATPEALKFTPSTAFQPEPAASSTPTLAPTETLAPSVTASLTPSRTAAGTLMPTEALPAEGTATRTQRPTRTPTATTRPRIPFADTYINRPGYLSKLSSPFQLDSYVIPSPGGTVRVELLGEDGRLLLRNLVQYNNSQDYRLPLKLQMDYHIPGVAETARLQLVVENLRGEVVYISSVDVILLSMGEAERNPPGDNLEPFFLQRPWGQQLIQGGTMTISGYLRPLNDQPLIFELYTDEGELAGSKQIAAEPVINGQHYPFELELPYTVSRATWARLTVRQADSRIPGDAALNSVQVWLKP